MPKFEIEVARRWRIGPNNDEVLAIGTSVGVIEVHDGVPESYSPRVIVDGFHSGLFRVKREDSTPPAAPKVKASSRKAAKGEPATSAPSGDVVDE